MKRLVFAVIMAFLFFVLLNFIYCNLDEATFSYQIVFKFTIPYVLDLQSVPIPMGFVLLFTFCTGMVAIALLEALPSMFKTLEIRAKNKRIRLLERELSAVRKMSEKFSEPSPSSPSGSGESS